MKRFVIGSFVLVSLTAVALEPPPPGSLDAYRKDGSLTRRAAFANQLGNHKVRPDVAQRALARMEALATGRQTKSLLPAWQGMPTKGTNNMLVFLIDFPDYAHVNDASLITNKLFGSGSPGEFPRESLRSYYQRSSYNQLHLQGNALGWYRMQHNRSWYETTYPGNSGNDANRAIIQEVIQAFDATHDFAQYDNNHDGKVDYFAVIWAGPDTGWSQFWWGYQWQLFNPITADGVQFEEFSWQWESRPVGSEFEAGTIIHETGHALGLPDYYDYDASVGLDGGGVGLDMMDGNYADHNAFSKFMLEWLTPMTVPAGQSNFTLRALAQFPDAVAVMPGYTGATPFTEYFVVENRQRVNNDTGNSSDGLLIWHVDATPDARGEDFLYNNSYTAHKLLRLMEADGLEEIETGDGRADAGDYFNQGESFGPNTTPNNRSYSGTNTTVTIDNISANGATMTVRCAAQGGVSAGPMIARIPSVLAQTTVAGTNAADQNFLVVITGGTAGYAISDNAAWLSVNPASGSSSGATNTHTVGYASSALSPGLHSATITITAPGASNSPQTIAVSLTVVGTNLPAALDTTNLTWTAGGASLWFEQNTTTHDGVDAAQSGALGHSQTNWIETTLTGPGQLSFWWSVSSEANYDFLRLYVDGQEQADRISGTVEWQSRALLVASGTHTIRWAYTKDGSVASGADAAWVDEVSFMPGALPALLSCNPTSIVQTATVGQNAAAQILEVWNAGGGTMDYTISDNAAWLTVTPASETSAGATRQHTLTYTNASLATGTYSATITITAPGANSSPKNVPVTLRVLPSAGSLGDAVDSPAFTWSTGGNASWSAQTSTTHDGQDAAASGAIADNQSSWMETTLQGPGTLAFWWKVSSEDGYDFLDVLVDGAVESSITGEIDWQQEFVAIPTGSHAVRWRYSKDSSYFAGADAGWLDQVTFTTGTASNVTVLSANFDSGLPAGWSVVDYAGEGAEWGFSDVAGRGNLTGGSGGFAIVDSDDAGVVNVETDLMTPVFNCAGYTTVTLEFNTDLYVDSGLAAVDLRTNGAWIRVWTSSASQRGPGTVRINLPQAVGKTNVMISFYYAAYYDWWWEVDNMRVTATAPAAAQGMVAQWRQAWEDFDRNYSYFTYKGIDWAPVFNAHSNAFAQINDATNFAVQLNSALQILHDWHAAVKKPDGSWIGYAGSYTNNYPVAPFTNYTGGAAYTNVRNASVLYHAWVASTIGHIVVNSLSSAAFAPITDADLDAIFTRYQNAAGLILDFRAKNGGDSANAARIASHLTDVPRAYGYTRTRVTGSDHDAFTPFNALLLQPSSGPRFTNKVVGLMGRRVMSSAEWFALMLRASPKATLIGDRTRGATANPVEFAQTNLNVSYLVSRWMGYTAEQVPFEDVGLQPDIWLAPGSASVDEVLRRDYVLESAIAWLKRPTLNIGAGLSAQRAIIAWPGEASSRYTLYRTTNLPPLWQLAPGWISNRIGVSGVMSYTNPLPAPPFEAYRLRVDY